ncbi:MAG: type I restriction endonuclease subunit R [Tessaracoccus sp.]|uniref:hypothetical protein n=1 Tax=Tessaracoccus sp. TaxID=1971211 RepID=UPI001ED1F2FB|nr:hypothetical protein [Tessaracoccus sp.]MBK7823491.1 type I restriction endonuclease subunit R [Tessaracoccus sp.]
MPWRTIDGRGLAPKSSPELEVLMKGVFDKRRFLDLLRHFVVFEEGDGGKLAKKMAGYQQFHAVNVAVAETLRAAALGSGEIVERGSTSRGRKSGGEAGDRRIGVVWHKPESGKEPDT